MPTFADKVNSNHHQILQFEKAKDFIDDLTNSQDSIEIYKKGELEARLEIRQNSGKARMDK